MATRSKDFNLKSNFYFFYSNFTFKFRKRSFYFEECCRHKVVLELQRVSVYSFESKEKIGKIFFFLRERESLFWFKGIDKRNITWPFMQIRSLVMLDFQRYNPWKLKLIKNVKDIVGFFLTRKVFTSVSFSIASLKQGMRNCKSLSPKKRKWE